MLSENDRMTRKIDKGTDILEHKIVQLNVIDIWQFLNPNTTEFTYNDPSCNMRNSRIDLLLCAKAVKSKCTKSVVTQAPAPDHRAVSVSVQITRNKRGKGYWKLNNSFVEHEEYHDGIVRIYEEVMEECEEYITKPILWAYFKLRVKQFSIAYGIKLANNFNDNGKTWSLS